MGLHRPDENRRRTIVQPKRRSLLAPSVPPAPPPRIRDPELDAMREADRARDLEMHPFSDRNKRRWKMYVLGSMVFFPLVTYVFSSAALRGLWFQLPIAAAYGTYLHFMRPRGVFAALGALLAGAITQAAVGVPMNTVGSFHWLLAMFVYGAAGLIVGITEHSNHINGE